MRIICIVIIFLSENVFSLEQLIMAQAVFRHGDRAPVEPVTSEEARQFYFRGTGQLTNVGMEQAAELGKELKLRLVNTGLLDRRMLPSQIRFESSSSERCLQTASAVGSGMFDPISANQPVTVPVSMRPKHNDFLLYPSLCEKMMQEQRTLLGLNETANFGTIVEQHGKIVSENSTYFGSEDRLKVLEPLLLERPAGLAVPVWFNTSAEEEARLIMFKSLSFMSGTASYHNPDWITVKSGMLLHTIMERIENTTQCKNRAGSCEQKKFYAYATHDIVLLSLMESLGVRETALGVKTSPPFAACILFELWNRDGSFYVKVMYRDPRFSFIPVTNSVPSCVGTEYCPVQHFTSCCNKFISTDTAAYCNNSSLSSLSSVFSITGLLMLVLLNSS